MQEISVPSPQFCHEPKTNLKKKFLNTHTQKQHLEEHQARNTLYGHAPLHTHTTESRGNYSTELMF